eukprot:CAMPEP_0175837744 /NCGR_PEP_ID=MMETSP0107_2-20121207/17858_1 /TAXON_ID=195067 ORGANISM="Goniomonas pacifica, Strain CCMP1869" /NCGR_SAMPLE_ID=MMETSP0107_2 /ASSEMBLY_ACC=CAM_ASM_000203 /LENGTH=45 /DNA_ID= /DNA_START= /DNA_END= /DNA_ORIENTATION=
MVVRGLQFSLPLTVTPCNAAMSSALGVAGRVDANVYDTTGQTALI